MNKGSDAGDLERLEGFAITMFRAFLVGIECNKSHRWSREASDNAEKCFVDALTDYRRALTKGKVAE